MGKVKFTQTMSLDGDTAGPEQTREEPLGKGGEELHEWMFATRTFRKMGGRRGKANRARRRRCADVTRTSGRDIMGRKRSARCAASGATRTGGAGGATTRRTMRQCSSSPTTP